MLGFTSHLTQETAKKTRGESNPLDQRAFQIKFSDINAILGKKIHEVKVILSKSVIFKPLTEFQFALAL